MFILNIVVSCLLQLISWPTGQTGRYFTGDIFKRIFTENVRISIQISMKFGPINNESALVRVMAWRLAITWTYADPVHWRIYAVAGWDEF